MKREGGGVSTMGATGWHEKGNNNGVVGEGQPSKQPVFLWELPVPAAFTPSLPADLQPREYTQKASADIFSIALVKCVLKDTIEGIFFFFFGPKLGFF